MIEMFINNKPLVPPSDLKIRVEINSPAFESDVIPSSIVYYFNVPVTQNEEVFNYANYVEVKNKYREYNWKMRFEGFWIFSGKLIVTQINTEFRCAASIKQLPTEFGDRNITDFTYDRILLGSKSMKEYVNEVRKQKSFTLSFPSIYAPNLYGEGESADNQDFGKIVNAMNIENTSSNVNTVIPCFHAIYIIETMFKSEGYQILNSFDHSFKELLLFNNYTLDQLPVENYAFSNLVGKTNLILTATDDPTNSIRFNKYYATPGEYEISIFAKAKFTSHSNPENTQMIVEASMVYTAHQGNPNGTRKEINRVKVEYDPNYRDKIDVFIDICFTQIFEQPGENWLYFEMYAYNSKGNAILRNYEITEGYIEIRRINSSTTDLNTYMKEINPVNHLPEISCSDFLLSFKQLLGFIYLFDFTNKTLQIVFMKDLLKTKVLDLTEQYISDTPDMEIKEPLSHELKYDIDEFNMNGYTYEGQYNSLKELPSPIREKLLVKIKNINSFYESKIVDNTLQWVRTADTYKPLVTHKYTKKESINIKLQPIAMDEYKNAIHPYYPERGVSALYSPSTSKIDKLICMLRTDAYGATTANMGYSILSNMFSFDLKAEDGAYNKYLKNWYDFISTANTYTFSFRVNIEDVFRILTLFNPQEGTPEEQTRRVRVLNQEYIPFQFTFEFSHNNIICQAKLMKNDND